MGRIGVRSQGDADSLIAGLKSLGADVEGIFTHFATADEADDSKFKRQLALTTAKVFTFLGMWQPLVQYFLKLLIDQPLLRLVDVNLRS